MDATTPTTTPTTAATGTSAGAVARSGRLRNGELRRQVAAFLDTHPGSHTAGQIARGLSGRSSGAVANALVLLVGRGDAALVTAAPARYTATAAVGRGASARVVPDGRTDGRRPGRGRSRARRDRGGADQRRRRGRRIGGLWLSGLSCGRCSGVGANPMIWRAAGRPGARAGLLAFGRGAHRCIGEHLGYAELEVGLSRLVSRLPGLRVLTVADRQFPAMVTHIPSVVCRIDRDKAGVLGTGV